MTSRALTADALRPSPFRAPLLRALSNVGALWSADRTLGLDRAAAPSSPSPSLADLQAAARDLEDRLTAGRALTLGAAGRQATPSLALLNDALGLEALAGLLAEIDTHTPVTLEAHLPSLDAATARRLAPEAAPPATLLAQARRLAAAGLAVRLVASPLVPGLNDDEDTLRGLAAAAERVGAYDLRGADEDTPTAATLLLHRLRLEKGFPRAIPCRG